MIYITQFIPKFWVLIYIWSVYFKLNYFNLVPYQLRTIHLLQFYWIKKNYYYNYFIIIYNYASRLKTGLLAFHNYFQIATYTNESYFTQNCHCLKVFVFSLQNFKIIEYFEIFVNKFQNRFRKSKRIYKPLFTKNYFY